jgi:hypothetical protein
MVIRSIRLSAASCSARTAWRTTGNDDFAVVSVSRCSNTLNFDMPWRMRLSSSQDWRPGASAIDPVIDNDLFVVLRRLVGPGVEDFTNRTPLSVRN